MSCFSLSAWIVALTLVVAGMNRASAEEPDKGPCTEDAMIVFDASGSMSGDGWGYGSESAGSVPRIDKVRTAMREILPSLTRFRRVGLITYGSGAWNQCTIRLDLKPTPNAADRIMAAIDALRAAGRTPLTDAVAQAADALDFRHKPGLFVVLTDGEETCGGSPCDLSE
jgi:Ca-activated chloride channel homolog